MKPCWSLWPSSLTPGENAARCLYFIVLVFCLFFGLYPPLTHGIIHTGVLAFLLGGGTVFLAVLYLPALKAQYPEHFAPLHRIFFLLLLAALLIYGAFAAGYRVYCRRNQPPDGTVPRTIIVLGGGIEGDRPRLILSRRLQAAKDYMDQNPEAVCVVSGGQGPDEQYPEAEVMYRYLVEIGADGGKIVQENQSGNTLENISFSADIITLNGFPTQAVVVTDDFHQLRAAVYCRRFGLEPEAITSMTPWGLLPSYEVREILALLKALLGF